MLTSEITLLCGNHHDEKTRGFLPNSVVIAANEDPWNVRSGVTKPYTLDYSGNDFWVNVGFNLFEGTNRGPRADVQIIRIDAKPMLWLELGDGHFWLNLD